MRRNANASAIVPRLSPWGSTHASEETKVFFQSTNNTQLYHNVPLLINNTNLLEGINQGAGGNQRIGSEIFLREFQCNLLVNNKDTRCNVTYRVVLVASANNNVSETYDECFKGQVFTGVHHPNTSVLLYDAFFPNNQGTTMTVPTKERSSMHVFRVPINKSVVYDTVVPGTCLTRLALYVVAYDAHATLTTDNIASVAQVSYRMIYTE